MSFGGGAVFLLVAILTGAILYDRRRRFTFWARVGLVVLVLLAMTLALLSGLGLL